MATTFIFFVFLQAVIFATCTGEACSEGWSTETTRYRILHFKEGPSVYVSCINRNYKVDGLHLHQCVEGELPTDLPRCVLIKTSCPRLGPPVSGTMRCSATAPEVGSSCTFECQSTHYLKGSKIRYCSQNLRWSGSVARCILKPECRGPSPLHQGTVIGCSLERKPRYNDTCHFRCNEGFQLVGPPYVRCRLDGRLTDEQGNQENTWCLQQCSETRPCQQNEECVFQESQKLCVCMQGYTRDLSSGKCKDINECEVGSESPCGQRALCFNVEGTYICRCPPGHDGDPRSICYPERMECKTDTDCPGNTFCLDEGNHCGCKAPFVQDGEFCILAKRSCSSTNPCAGNQQCTDTGYGFGFCICPRGYTEDASGFCRAQSNAGRDGLRNKPRPVSPTSWLSCRQHNGHCSQQCHQESRGIRCSCGRGYRLAGDGRTCIDEDECRDRNLNKCDHLCRNTDGGYECLCRQGYTSPDGFRCIDVDECLDDKLNKCDHTCENTVGGYKCSCRAGFISSDGFRCEGCRVNSYRGRFDIACRDCPAHSRTDGEGKASINDCVCNPGFTGNPGKGIPCKDIDECADGKRFGCSHTCMNTPGGAHCACPFGYQLKEDQKNCIDIDECSIKNGGCDGICHNTDGNFTCSCPEGFVSSPDDRYSCDDVDECAIGNGGCSEECVNFKGGFHCFCSEGYHLHPDGKSCIPTIRCPRVPVPHHSTLRCKNPEDAEKVIFKPGEMPEDKEFPAGALCRVKCDRGYDFRDSHPGIVCQNDGKWNASLPECRVLQCPPLSPPVNGDVYPPSCKEGSAEVKQKCVFTCLPGYRITGHQVFTCRNNLTWPERKPVRCVPETEVSISCPDDDITVELMSNESLAEIQLNSPRTSVSAGLVRVRPDWLFLDRASVFPAGETEVIFSVTSDNQTAECSIFVIVLDKHPPVFTKCPDTLFVTSGIAGTAVDWEEPVPEDNVGIASVHKSLEPNSTLSPGVHFVEYVARDFAGNVGQCTFQVNVTAGGCTDLADPENGESNCLEWTLGKICQPTCFENFTRPAELFACDESGTWMPTDFISPCLPECPEDETWFPEFQKCVKTS